VNILQSATTKLGNIIELIGNEGKNNVLIIGVFHGDEPQGKYLIERYLSEYSPSPQPSPHRVEGAIYMHSHNYTPFAQLKSKELRQNSTEAEKKLWNILRNNQINNLHFKRQKPIGNYIVDFVCLKEKIIIELDGGQHNEPKNIAHDKERTNYLISLGYKIIRIWNNEIFENFEGVKEYLYNSLAPREIGMGREVENNFLAPLGRGLGRGAEIDSLAPLGREVEKGADADSLAPLGRGLGRGADADSLAPLGRGLGRGAKIDSLAPLGRGLGRGANNLIFIPCLNPDGMQNNTRTNANGVDLNRNFPTKNWGEDTSKAGDNPADYYGGTSPASEIETQFVIDVIEKYQPKLILTLHAPYKIVNYDGPAKEIAQKISNIIGYPVEESIGYPTPGSFGTYCGVERNIPTITLELDEKIPVAQLEQPVFEIFDIISL
jgi:protein MpaA